MMMIKWLLTNDHKDRFSPWQSILTCYFKSPSGAPIAPVNESICLTAGHLLFFSHLYHVHWTYSWIFHPLSILKGHFCWLLKHTPNTRVCGGYEKNSVLLGIFRKWIGNKTVSIEKLYINLWSMQPFLQLQVQLYFLYHA